VSDQPPSSPIPFVLDTDIGTDVDDALALTLALASPELDLLGVTVVDGDVELRARMAARLLGMAGRDDIPVVIGEGQPIGVGRGPTHFGHEGEGLLDVPWDGPEAPISEIPAAEWLVELSHERPYYLSAVGPFTNVARAVELDPTYPGRTLGLAVMGGMVHAESFTQPWLDFFAATGIPPNHMDHNTASDVEAAITMARAGFDMTWVTAELTFPTILEHDAIGQFRSSGSTLGDRLATMVEIWSERHYRRVPRRSEVADPIAPEAVASLHDPLTIAAIFGGEWIDTRDHWLAFGVGKELFEIREVPEGEAEAKHTVSVGVDAAAFNEFYRNRVVGFLNSLSG
jgi:purine nucleosidase